MKMSLLKHAYSTVLYYSKEMKRAAARKFLAFFLALAIRVFISPCKIS
jgi:hypothetical protein